MARAMTSLPVPLSPSIKMVALVGATRAMSLFTSAISGLTKSSEESVSTAASCVLRLAFSSRSSL